MTEPERKRKRGRPPKALLNPEPVEADLEPDLPPQPTGTYVSPTLLALLRDDPRPSPVVRCASCRGSVWFKTAGGPSGVPGLQAYCRVMFLTAWNSATPELPEITDCDGAILSEPTAEDE